MFFYLLILACTLYFLFEWLGRQKYYKMGLKGPKPLPFFGNQLDFVFRPFAEYDAECLRKYGQTYVDFVVDTNGVIVTSNPDHVKKILVNSFTNFSFRQQPTYRQPLARKAVIFQNEDWKRIRSQVTPVFTSGRLRIMYKNFEVPVQTCLNNIQELINEKKNKYVDVKKLMKSFALDMIGNVVFSFQTNSFKDDNFSKKVMDLFKVNRLVVLILFFLPKPLIRFFRLSFLNTDTLTYFNKLTLNLMDERKKNKSVVYNDFIALLLKSEAEGEVEKNTEADGHLVKKLSQEEIVAQCFIFFVAGMETISTTLSLVLYELAVNKDIQEKLYEDLIANHPEDEIPYDDINKSVYLDAVLNEALRKHTTLSRVFRKAHHPYDFGEFKISAGQTMGISLQNLHHDPNLYEEPDKFKPERFLENKDLKSNIIFSPFLDGPRNCIGNRFAIVEMKKIIIQLVKKYRVINTDKTYIKQKKSVILNMIEDVTLGFEERK